MTSTTTLPIALVNLQYLVDMNRSMNESCSLFSLTVIVVITPLSFLAFLLRAWSLLFRYQITEDLQARSACGTSFMAGMERGIGGVMSINTKSGSGAHMTPPNPNNQSGGARNFATIGNNGGSGGANPSSNGNGGSSAPGTNGRTTPNNGNDEKQGQYRVSVIREQDTCYEPSAAVQRIPPVTVDVRRESNSFIFLDSQYHAHYVLLGVVSWYTRNHHLYVLVACLFVAFLFHTTLSVPNRMRAKYILRIFAVVTVLGVAIGIIVAVDRGSTPCNQVSQGTTLLALGYCFIVILTEMILVLIVSKKLSRFDRDTLG
jgi:hypothetical protein